MKTSKSLRRFVGLLVFSLAFAGASGYYGYTVYADHGRHMGAVMQQAAALQNAARKARLSLQTEHLVTGSANGVILAAAPIAGIERIPATTLPHGVDAAFMYLSSASDAIPDGYYVMRWSATPQAVEEAFRAFQSGLAAPPGNAMLELVDMDGSVVARLPAALQEVSSLTPPPTASRAANFMDEAIEVDRVRGGVVQPQTITITIWVECSNGFRVCVKITIPL